MRKYLLTLCLFVPTVLLAATLKIENQVLSVNYDEATQTFSTKTNLA